MIKNRKIRSEFESAEEVLDLYRMLRLAEQAQRKTFDVLFMWMPFYFFVLTLSLYNELLLTATLIFGIYMVCYVENQRTRAMKELESLFDSDRKYWSNLVFKLEKIITA